MAGLGERGQKQVAKSPLFTPTEKQGSKEAVTTESNKAVVQERPKMVAKTFQFSEDLAEKLRICAFKSKRKEVDIVREALDTFLANEQH